MKRLIAIILLLSLLTVPASATVLNFAGGTYYGLSSDTKPNSSEGSRFWESDTKKWYLRQSGVWVDWTPTGGGTPSDTVTTETDFGQSSTPGTSSEYSRGNHSHGTPADSTPAHSSLTTGIHGVSSGNVASTSDISTHATVTQSTHNFDASGNAPPTAPTASTLGGVKSKTCIGTDKVSGLGTDGVLVCTADQGGSGTFAVTQVEVDFGATAVHDAEFTITDASITTTSKILCSMAYVATTNNDADEISMSRVYCSPGLPGTGSFTMLVGAADGPISGKLKVNYSFAN